MERVLIETLLIILMLSLGIWSSVYFSENITNVSIEDRCSKLYDHYDGFPDTKAFWVRHCIRIQPWLYEN